MSSMRFIHTHSCRHVDHRWKGITPIRSFKEVAEILGITVQQAYALERSALDKLRHAMPPADGWIDARERLEAHYAFR